MEFQERTGDRETRPLPDVATDDGEMRPLPDVAVPKDHDAGGQALEEPTDDRDPLPQPNVAAGAAASDGDDDGQAQANRRFLCQQALILFILILVLTVLLVTLGSTFLDRMLRVGRHVRKSRDRPATVATVVIGCISFTALPLPGRIPWNLVIAYAYGWPAFFFLAGGHAFGSLLAFLGARLWAQKCSTACCVCAYQCCCVRRDGTPRHMFVFILSSLIVVEQRPFFTVCMIGFSPLPSFLPAYVFGAMAKDLLWQQFFLPYSFSGLKLLFPCYLASRADDLDELMKGEQDPAGVVGFVLSTLLAVAVLVIVTRGAAYNLKKARLRLAASSAEDDPAASNLESVTASETKQNEFEGVSDKRHDSSETLDGTSAEEFAATDRTSF